MEVHEILRTYTCNSGDFLGIMRTFPKVHKNESICPYIVPTEPMKFQRILLNFQDANLAMKVQSCQIP